MKIAFLTCADLPALAADDLVAVRALTKRGIEVIPRVWDAEAPPPADLDAAIVRSCWNYHQKTAPFLATIDQLAASGITVLNPPSVVRWNVDKRYLADLAFHGARIPRTVWVSRGDDRALEDIVVANDLGTVVVKPRISLSAWCTFVSSRDARDPSLRTSDEAKFRELVAARDVLVQGFVPEIAEGEVSLVFLGGRFSHAVRKTPRKGDFRVQSDYGGIHELIDADPAWVREAERVLLLAIASPLVYARVDVVVTPAGLVWMELEATDPELFFRLEPRAAETFADAIVAAIEPRTHRRPT